MLVVVGCGVRVPVDRLPLSVDCPSVVCRYRSQPFPAFMSVLAGDVSLFSAFSVGLRLAL